ncbi:MAG: tetratricopeptide repeat protein, partial [Gammaproteobacteria bacterium]|nr:tetratricopeptide repeat protein [Gammaproteobacteria bacterium]
EEALQAFQRSLAIVEKLYDENNIAIQLNSLGGVLRRLNRLEEALEAFQRSLAIAEKLNDENNIAIQLNSLGGVLRRLNRPEEALEAFQRSLTIAEKLNDKHGQAIRNTNLGKILKALNKPEQAIKFLSKAFNLDAELGNSRGLEIITPILIRMLVSSGRIEDARAAYQYVLGVIPKSNRILALKRLLQPKQSDPFSGEIKYLSDAKYPPGLRYGFVLCDGGGPDVYFYEPHIRPADPALLRKGVRVKGTADKGDKGPVAVTLELEE